MFNLHAAQSVSLLKQIGVTARLEILQWLPRVEASVLTNAFETQMICPHPLTPTTVPTVPSPALPAARPTAAALLPPLGLTKCSGAASPLHNLCCSQVSAQTYILWEGFPDPSLKNCPTTNSTLALLNSLTWLHFSPEHLYGYPLSTFTHLSVYYPSSPLGCTAL